MLVAAAARGLRARGRRPRSLLVAARADRGLVRRRRHGIACSRWFWRCRRAQARTAAARLFHRPARRHALGVRGTARRRDRRARTYRSTTSGAASTSIHVPGRARLAVRACPTGRASGARKSSSACRRCSNAARCTSTPDSVAGTAQMADKIVVLSGSGLSAESGLPTFRDAAGLWNQYSWRELASPDGWRKHPEVVLAFYNERRAKAWAAQPNAAHLAIASLEQKFDVVVITQNVDSLHERAGSTRVLHVHGELAFARGTGPIAPPLPHRRRAHRARTELRGRHAAAAGHRVVRRGDAAHGRSARATWRRPTRCWWSAPR